MEKRALKPVDILIIVSIILLIAGIADNNNALNLVSLMMLLTGIILKSVKRDAQKATVTKTKSTNKKSISTNKLNADRVKYFKDYVSEWQKEDNNKFGEEYVCYNNNCCPNCGCILDSKVTSSKKCPECKEKIVLRTNKLNSEKLLLSEKRMKEYEKHERKMSEILFCDRIMKNKEFIYQDYMNEFYAIKNRSVSIRDIMWQFANKVGSDLDNQGYKQFMIASRLNKYDRSLEMYNAIHLLKLAIQEYVTMYSIANFEGQKDVALNLLTDVAYRDIQCVELDKETDTFRKFTLEDYISEVHSALIIEFLDKNGYTVDDFKKRFIEMRHPFILERLSNQTTWEYIEASLERQIKWNNRNK